MNETLRQGSFYTDSTDSGRGDVLVISNDAFNRVFGRALALPVRDMEPRFAAIGPFCLPTGSGKAICIYQPTVVAVAGWTETGCASPAEFRKAIDVFNTITEFNRAVPRAAMEIAS